MKMPLFHFLVDALEDLLATYSQVLLFAFSCHFDGWMYVMKGGILGFFSLSFYGFISEIVNTWLFSPLKHLPAAWKAIVICFPDIDGKGKEAQESIISKQFSMQDMVLRLVVVKSIQSTTIITIIIIIITCLF